MKRSIPLFGLAGFGLLAALVGCSGRAVTDGSAGSVGGSGDAGGASTAGNPGTSGSGVGGGGVGGSAGASIAGSAGKGGSAGSASECSPGETMMADCNGCQCFGGHWACTLIACASVACGGFAGNTCKATEYCAYTPGQLCGQGDASATCQPRPDGCVDLYMPVCGCDQMTYSSSCDAAMHGQGVYAVGVCGQGTAG